MISVEIQINDSRLIDAINELSELLKDSPKFCLERFNRFFSFRNSRSKLFSINSECLMTGVTGECWVVLEPSNLLLNAIAAMRTRDF